MQCAMQCNAKMEKKILLIVLFGACLHLSSAVQDDADREAPRFTINLDLPPKQRWHQVISLYKEEIMSLIMLAKTLVPKMVLDFIAGVGLRVKTAVPYPYNYEIMGIAENLKGVSMGDIILANALYEFTTFNHSKPKEGACTSIVAEAKNGTIFHGRNLDYSLVGLQTVTITLDFKRGGKTVYTGTTFAGYIGLLTGQKPHGYTISLNQRNKGRFWMNMISALINGMNAVSVFHIRDVLDNEEFDYEKTLVHLSNVPLIAPCYLIIGGIHPGQGVVITRGRIAALDLWKINPEKGEWFRVETNYDHWEAPPVTDNRRDPANEGMNKMGQTGVGVTGLFDVLSIEPPVLNNKTTFTVVMSASHPELYTTWIRQVPID